MKVTPVSPRIGDSGSGRLSGFLGRQSEFLRVGRYKFHAGAGYMVPGHASGHLTIHVEAVTSPD